MTRHLERVDWSPSVSHPPDTTQWPFTIPAVAQLIREGGMNVAPGVTFLIGENGSGKSTVVEALARCYPRHGNASTYAPHNVGPRSSSEDSPLCFNLRASVNKQASPGGFFLRAEAMHEFLSGVDASPAEARGWAEGMQTRSHGESFLAVLRHRFNDVGVYFLDEPEAALSFNSCLGLISLLDSMRREGSQIIVATHSPLLVSLPGATLLQLSDEGTSTVDRFDDLTLVKDWRAFLGGPGRYLKHLIGQPA